MGGTHPVPLSWGVRVGSMTPVETCLTSVLSLETYKVDVLHLRKGKRVSVIDSLTVTR